MDLKEKHAKLWDLYWTKFVNTNPVVSGYCVPLEYISDNKGYAGDGTINMAELLTLQALSVALQVEKDWDPVKYVRCHPGGALGQLRDGEKK